MSVHSLAGHRQRCADLRRRIERAADEKLEDARTAAYDLGVVLAETNPDQDLAVGLAVDVLTHLGGREALVDMLAGDDEKSEVRG